MRSLTILLLPLILILSGCTSVSSKPTFQTDSGAIRGYDTVAYFTEERAVPGSPEFSLEHNGATWYFSSKKNLEMFKNNPEKYSPQYGGYCAYAMSKGFVVSSDPEAFTIVDDKLYLNYSLAVRDTWSKDIPTYIKQGDANWLKKTGK